MKLDLKAIWTLIKSAASSWVDDYAPSMGAALAYYTVFSIAPLILIVISVTGLVFGQDAARGEIYGQLKDMMGPEGAATIQSAVEAVNKPAQSIISTIIGFIVLIIGATTVFGELQDALDRIWRAPARKSGGIWNLLRARVLSFGMILGIGFLLMVSLLFSAGLSALGNWYSPMFGGWEVLLNIVNFLVSFALVTCVFAMIYKIMPRVHIQWIDVWVGAAVTSFLFTVGKFLIGLYIGKASVASGFGAAGSLAVLLVWVYYSAQIFLVGAEFTWVYAHTFGSRKGMHQAAAAVAAPAPEVPSRGDASAAAGVVAATGAPVAVKPDSRLEHKAASASAEPSAAPPSSGSGVAAGGVASVNPRTAPQSSYGNMLGWNLAWKRADHRR